MWEQEKDDNSIAIEDAKQRFTIENKWGRKQKKSASVLWPDENRATEIVKHT
jgi:hypothetical protein